MPIPVQSVTFGFGLQAAKVGKDGTFDDSGISFYKLRTPRVSVGTIQDQQVFPPEIGGALTPNGAYKQMMFFGGDFDVIPRLETSIGVLLKAAMGDVTTTTDADYDGTAITGLNSHLFKFASDGFTLPYLAVRRLIPADTGSAHGETGFDCRVNSLRLTIPAMGKLAARAVVVGRDAVYDDGSTWSWENAAYESFVNTPDAGSGFFKIDGTEYNVAGAVIDLNNGVMRPQDGMIVGDFHPADLDVMGPRGATIRLVYRWQDPELWNQLHTGAVDGTSWSPLPFISETGASKAFEGYFCAPDNLATPVPATPAGIHIVANSVVWAAQPMELRAGGLIQQTILGTVLTPDSGEYLEIALDNDIASY